MALMNILAGAQDGALYANVGKAVGLNAADTAKAMEVLCPAIARQLKAKSQDDAGTFENLLDLIEDGACDDASLTGGEAVADGTAILDHIYGSHDAAIGALGKLAAQVPDAALEKLAALSATSVLGAMAKSHAAMPLAGAAPVARAGGGLFGTIVSAIIKGAIQSAARQLAPRRRRRGTSYFGTKRKRRTTARKRTRTPSLEDIFGELLGTKRR
jgi:hypothetical protein